MNSAFAYFRDKRQMEELAAQERRFEAFKVLGGGKLAEVTHAREKWAEPLHVSFLRPKHYLASSSPRHSRKLRGSHAAPET